jgi:hypothetical protein
MKTGTSRFVPSPRIPASSFGSCSTTKTFTTCFTRDEIYRKLKQHIPGYEKALAGIFERTQPALPTAIERAKRLQERHSPERDTEGPFTNVDSVVVLLLSMKRPD